MVWLGSLRFFSFILIVILPKGCSCNWVCTESGYFSVIEFECDSCCNETFSFKIDREDKALQRFKDLEYKKSKITPAIEYIAKNYNTDIKNDDMARLCNLSTVYFRKLFTEVFGISPIVYVHELRIKKDKLF